MTPLMLLLVVLLKLTLAADYIKEDECEERTNCVYKYTVSGEMLNGEETKEEIKIDAQVTLRCKSKGTFSNQLVHYYCIDVKDATVTIFGQEVEQAANGTTTSSRKLEKDRAKLSTSVMGQDFCFVRNELGKILSVFYPPGEETDIVNFKKTLVSAFQVNFAKTEVEEETDSQSRHIAHYSYENNINGSTTEHRTVRNEDVFSSSGFENPSSETVEFLNREDIEVNENRTVERSHGESWTLLTKLGSDEEELDDDDDDHDDKQDTAIQPIEIRSHYTLELIQCQYTPKYNDKDDEFKLKVDNLMTRYNEFEQDEAELQELYNTVPDLQETVHRAPRSTGTFEKHTERALSKWRRLLYLESKHGAIKGRRPAIDTLIEQLNDIINEDTSIHQHLRAMIYSLLSTEGGEKSQQVLISLLERPEISQDEFQNIILAIAMLPSVHLSTVAALKKYIFQNALIETEKSEQLLLAFASLGRYNNVENEVVDTIVELMAMLKVTANNNTNSTISIHLIHALGNIGSKMIIPYVSPFLERSNNMQIFLAAIDALRTVSTDKRVMNLFSKLLDSETDINVAMAIVESLMFPFESYIYFPVKPKAVHVSESLIDKIVNIALRSGNFPLLKATEKYLKYIGIKQLPGELQLRRKRASTTMWNSASSTYNSIASYASRQSDVSTYPIHKAYLWTKTIGPSKIHAKLSTGGFGGAGVSALKGLGIIKFDLYAYGRTYTAVRGEISAEINTNSASAKLYFKVIGITLLQSNNHASLSYTQTWSRTYSQRMFNAEFRVWVWIGYVSFYLQGHISASVSLNLAVEIGKIETSIDAGPKFTVTGGASITLLVIYRVGLEVNAGIGYYVTPKASANAWCDYSCPSTDATACFRIFHGSRGVDVDIYAFYQRKSCRISGWRLKCSWKSKKKLSLYSDKFTLGAALTPKLLYGECHTFPCISLLHNTCPPPTTPTPTYPTMPQPQPQPSVTFESGSGEEPPDIGVE